MRAPASLGAAAFLCALLAAAPAIAQDTHAPSPAAVKDAEAHFHRGVSLYKDGDYGGALVEFRRAYELAPNYRVLYDIGQSYYLLQKYSDALSAFENYLSKGGAHIPAARRASVENDLRTLRTRVGHVAVTVTEDGDDVSVDDQSVGTSPMKDPVLVSVGHRKVTVTKAGRPPVDKFVDVAAGDSIKVAFDMTASAPPPPAPTPAAPPAPAEPPPAATPPSASQGPAAAPGGGAPGPSSRGGVWIPWTVTGVLAVGTVVTGVLALTSQATYSQQLGDFPGNPGAIADDRNRAKAFAIANDVLLGATAVSLGVSLYWTLVPAHDAGGAGTGGAGAPARAAIVLLPSGVGVVGEY
jgi:hypothetical protein